ncbi:spore coat protein A [Bradyrhizobium sp. CCBAU 051011]|uniref:multicopper oxidase family protein n=1 Tax=Bradyrhizobium sp. CCBAU 051011 TaxID=858422 RepID=UPI00137403CC|nr:multicopper oxidase domain-containing protein [Bradyrhizobium sp. CCBAU 051011]QHO72484.1 spore coat protein A [Bradyrhizobium sp. CCBAU 051011]
MSLLDSEELFESHAFENALPIPEVIDATKGRDITLQARQISQFLGLYDPDGNLLYTTVWGYGTGMGKTSYPGPTILAYEDVPVTVHWQNKLPLTGHLLPVDTSLHFANSLTHPLSSGYVPIVSHLHGGHNDSIFDGLPDQWFTQSGGGNGPRGVGPGFVTSTMTYYNDQQAATLWYHDHALGITRLNVYAGLAGFYVLQDESHLDLVKNGVLPGGNYDLGMAIQDRAFTSDGQLYYPAYKDDPLPGTDMTVGDVVPQKFYDTFGEDAPSAVPEFFGDTILVNGMAWPKLNVAAGDYEFRLLNGSDSRFYVLKVSDPDVAVHLVGTDGGLLPNAITISDGDGVQESNEFLVLAPGDRVELVFDFSRLDDGDTVTLLNVGPAFDPFKGISADGFLFGDIEAANANNPVGDIMQFAVDTAIKPFDATVQDGIVLVKDFVSLTEDANHDDVADLATNVRKVGLFEGEDEYGRVTPMLGKAEAGTVITDKMSSGDFGPLAWDAPTTEKPLLGSTEQWDMFNFTADSHPIHLHLPQFQVLGKWHIDFLDQDENGIPDDTNSDGEITYGTGPSPNYAVADIWIGDKIDLRPEETGWQDTIEVDPHQMVAVIATFDKPGDYVWHCHILSHEDNEMMRPYTVVTDFGLFA